jgi:hypothetical protein
MRVTNAIPLGVHGYLPLPFLLVSTATYNAIPLGVHSYLPLPFLLVSTATYRCHRNFRHNTEGTSEVERDKWVIFLWLTMNYVTTLMTSHNTEGTSEVERDKWVFFMQMASGTLPDDVGTATERLLRKISTASFESTIAAQSELQAIATDTLPTSLTTLLSTELEAQAVGIWKSHRLYTSVQIESAAYEYHVLLAQGLIERCLLYVGRCLPPPPC